MSEVSLPTALGSRRETSINDIDHLPLGNILYEIDNEVIRKKNTATNELTTSNNFLVSILQIIKNSTTSLTVKYFSGDKIYTNESFIDTDIITVSYTYNKTAAVTTNLNDDTEGVEQKTINNPDIYDRNKNYDDYSQLTYMSRSLVGKASKQTGTTLHDMQMMTAFDKKNNTRIVQQEYRDYKESHYNLVSSPFTTAEKFIIP